MILAAIVILMAVAFITYLPQYDITKDRIQNSLTTSMLVTDVGNKFDMLVTDFEYYSRARTSKKVINVTKAEKSFILSI